MLPSVSVEEKLELEVCGDHGADYVLSTQGKRRGTSVRIKAHQTYLCENEFIVFYARFPRIAERQGS
jgi:hypothetical protein